MCCASDNHNYMCHTCAKKKKKKKIRASIKQLLTKYQIFTILPQISHFHKYRNFSSIFATFKTNCFIPINFISGTCQEYSFIFASCELLTESNHVLILAVSPLSITQDCILGYFETILSNEFKGNKYHTP